MRRRTGFTLVEMMVAMALTVFIMAILSSAFSTGLETFRQLKGIGNMQEGLRITAMRLRADLSADHFDGKRRLSDPYFWLEGPPREGFFVIEQKSISQKEGDDLDGLPLYKATNHILHFSVKLRGNRRENFFAAGLPAGCPLLTTPTNFFNQPPDTTFQATNFIHSQWAEIAYYLKPSGTTIEPTNPSATVGTPLFSLYRVQRIVFPDNSQVLALASPPLAANIKTDYAELSCQPNGANAYFNTPADLATGPTKRGFNNDPALGASLLLSNVVSFQVQILALRDTDFHDLGGPFDTAVVPPGPPPPVQALQISIRVWDPQTRQSRQSTILQDL